MVAAADAVSCGVFLVAVADEDGVFPGGGGAEGTHRSGRLAGLQGEGQAISGKASGRAAIGSSHASRQDPAGAVMNQHFVVPCRAVPPALRAALTVPRLSVSLGS